MFVSTFDLQFQYLQGRTVEPRSNKSYVKDKDLISSFYCTLLFNEDKVTPGINLLYMYKMIILVIVYVTSAFIRKNALCSGLVSLLLSLVISKHFIFLIFKKYYISISMGYRLCYYLTRWHVLRMKELKTI